MTELSNALLETILEQVRTLTARGNVASYIPALAEVPASALGIAVVTTDRQCYQAGEAQTRFSVPSISKVLPRSVTLSRYSDKRAVAARRQGAVWSAV
ncbi:Glutaminase 2|nr:Glutaminase 2 [Candidatus Pantoea persica]